MEVAECAEVAQWTITMKDQVCTGLVCFLEESKAFKKAKEEEETNNRCLT